MILKLLRSPNTILNQYCLISFQSSGISNNVQDTRLKVSSLDSPTSKTMEKSPNTTRLSPAEPEINRREPPWYLFLVLRFGNQPLALAARRVICIGLRVLSGWHFFPVPNRAIADPGASPTQQFHLTYISASCFIRLWDGMAYTYECNFKMAAGPNLTEIMPSSAGCGEPTTKVRATAKYRPLLVLRSLSGHYFWICESRRQKAGFNCRGRKSRLRAANWRKEKQKKYEFPITGGIAYAGTQSIRRKGTIEEHDNRLGCLRSGWGFMNGSREVFTTDFRMQESRS